MNKPYPHWTTITDRKAVFPNLNRRCDYYHEVTMTIRTQDGDTHSFLEYPEYSHEIGGYPPRRIVLPDNIFLWRLATSMGAATELVLKQVIRMTDTNVRNFAAPDYTFTIEIKEVENGFYAEVVLNKAVLIHRTGMYTTLVWAGRKAHEFIESLFAEKGETWSVRST